MATPGSTTPEMKREMYRLYRTGLSYKSIGKIVGLHTKTVGYHIQKSGIKRRPRAPEGEKNWFHRGGPRCKAAAVVAVNAAIKKGILVRPKLCSECGKPKVKKNGASDIHGHHCDYSKPLDVMWLCKTCHFKWHKQYTAINQ